MRHSQPPSITQARPIYKTRVPRTIEDFYMIKIDYINRAIKLREERNWGRRMNSWTNKYSWTATSWDWILEELKYIGTDTMDGLKWKKAAAYKLANEVKKAIPKIMEEWRCKETAGRLISIKNSAIIKQAFYDQYKNLKKAKEEGKSISSVSIKKVRTGGRLQELMRWIILNYEFQYEVPTSAFDKLYKCLYPNTERKKQSGTELSTTDKHINAMNDIMKDVDGEIFSSNYETDCIGPSSNSLFYTISYNDESQNLLILYDPSLDTLLAPVPMPLNDQLGNINLSSLPTLPLCTYDNIIDTQFDSKGECKIEKPNTNPVVNQKKI